MFVPSGWGNSMSASKARERLGTRTRVCSYDYLGRGWSDAPAGVTTIGGMASNLGVLQDRAKLAGPFLLVASSIGGLVAEMFARTYPERVAGIVFVDASNSALLQRLVPRRWTITALACAAGTLSRFGVIRLLDPFDLGSDSEGARRSAAISYGARPWTATCALARGFTATEREFAQAPPLPTGLPVAVLTASSARQLLPSFAERFVDVQQLRVDAERTHRELATRLHGSWKMVPDSSHLIADSQPDAVADAAFDLLDGLK
jgi:pimeloyl-ACP methyl ester carboxylesterase